MCDKQAEWTIVHGLDDYTEACSDHVGALLTDAPVHHIYPIGASLNAEQVEKAKCCFLGEKELNR